MDKQEIFGIIAGHIADILPGIEPGSITISKSLSELGANSIDRVDILMMTMESLSLNLPMSEFAGASNLQELVDLLHAKL